MYTSGPATMVVTSWVVRSQKEQRIMPWRLLMTEYGSLPERMLLNGLLLRQPQDWDEGYSAPTLSRQFSSWVAQFGGQGCLAHRNIGLLSRIRFKVIRAPVRPSSKNSMSFHLPRRMADPGLPPWFP